MKDDTQTEKLAERQAEERVEEDGDTINIFVPINIKKRGGTAMIITSQNSNSQDSKINFDDSLIKTIGKAHKWKMLMGEGKIGSLADIARKEKVGTSYVSKVFNLNFISPRIIKRILAGTQPKTLRLQDIVSNRKLPELWEEQEEILGF
jgi:hypothetical protein